MCSTSCTVRKWERLGVVCNKNNKVMAMQAMPSCGFLESHMLQQVRSSGLSVVTATRAHEDADASRDTRGVFRDNPQSAGQCGQLGAATQRVIKLSKIYTCRATPGCDAASRRFHLDSGKWHCEGHACCFRGCAEHGRVRFRSSALRRYNRASQMKMVVRMKRWLPCRQSAQADE